MDTDLKICSKCNELKNPVDFYATGRRCRSCVSEYNRLRRLKDPEGAKTRDAVARATTPDRAKISKYHQNNPTKRKSYTLKKFGMTVEEYETMATSQSNKCAICPRDRSALVRDLAVDHSHETGLIRGLLCTKCNTGLGMFNDDPELLLSAIRYLQK